MSKKIGVYCVCDKYKKVFYVGSSSNISKRLANHRMGNTHLHWKLYVQHLQYTKTLKAARKLEKIVINELNILGFNLLNTYLKKGDKK
jgi:excinuclease UvrABC nuclease subunit